jgi:hypothetical protein
MRSRSFVYINRIPCSGIDISAGSYLEVGHFIALDDLEVM